MQCVDATTSELAEGKPDSGGDRQPRWLKDSDDCDSDNGKSTPRSQCFLVLNVSSELDLLTDSGSVRQPQWRKDSDDFDADNGKSTTRSQCFLLT